MQKGLFVIEFDREAPDFRTALISAVRDVRRTGAIIERIEPDHLVSASDISLSTGLSRSTISLYASGKRGEGFPAPIARVTTESPLWDWAEVANWTFKTKQISEEVLIEAAAIRDVNVAIVHIQRPVSSLERELQNELAAA